MKTLHLTLKQVYFDQILQGIKKVEYREVKPYWITRLTTQFIPLTATYIFKNFDTITFYNGGSPSKKYRHFTIELKNITINNLETPIGSGKFFELHLGEILSEGNL